MESLTNYPASQLKAKLDRFIKPSLQAGLLVILLGIYAYFLFYHLGARPFIDWDESIYAQVAKEAFLNHHYLSFTFWGNHWFEKPPLMLWTTILGFKTFGINELGARFFVAVFAFGTIILTLLLVKKISRSFLAVFLTLACFAVCYQFFFNSFFLQFDTAITFFVLLSIYAFLLGLEQPKFFYLFFVGLALGVLTKSVIGLLPLPIVFIYLLVSRQFRLLNNKHFYYGSAVFAVLVLPWHIWESIKFGKSFWNVYLLYHVFDRYIKPLENNGGPFSYYFPVLWQNSVFKALLVVSVPYFVFQSYKKNLNYFLLLLASVFIFLFFSLAQTKGYSYIVVMYPYIMAMFGLTLNDLLGKSPFKILKFAAIGVLVVVFLGLGWQEQNYKILSLENSADAMPYAANKNIAAFINDKYPAETIYVKSWVEGNLAFEYYLGRTVTGLPKNLPPNLALPPNFDVGPRYRVFHQIKRSVYRLPGYLYISP